MTPVQILDELRTLGLSFKVVAGVLKVSPSKAATPAIRPRIEAAKADLINLVVSEQYAEALAALGANLPYAGDGPILSFLAQVEIVSIDKDVTFIGLPGEWDALAKTYAAWNAEADERWQKRKLTPENHY